MIVKCGNCQTRFKIPDEKVTDKGVKVRCTKCQNTFRVTRADAQPPAGAASPPPVGDDPFARFGPSTDSIHAQETRPFTLPPDLLSAQQKVTAHNPLKPSYEAQSDVPPELFDQPTRIGPPPARPAAPPPSAHGHAPPAFDPFDFAKEPTQQSSPPTDDPFGFGALPAAPSSAAAPDPFDFDSPTRVNHNAVNAAAGASTSADPFDFGAPSPSAATAPSFDFGSLGDPAPPPPAVAPNSFGAAPANAFDDSRTMPAPQQSAPPAFADPFGQPEGQGFADPFAQQDAQQHGQAQMTDPFGEPATRPASSAANPFGESNVLPDVLPPDAPSMGGADMDARAMFDMPARKPSPPPEDEPAPVPVAAIKLTKVPASEISNPSARTVEAPEEEKGSAAGAAKKVTGVFVNIAIAAALLLIVGAVGLVYMNEGKLEAQSFQPARLMGMLSPTSNWQATDISNGLYDTRGGKPVFFVRGEVKNKSGKPALVKVRAEILDGAALVRSAEVYAGAAPTPEELYGIGSAADVDALAAKLQKASAEVAPSSTAPFLITFYEYPPDLSGFRLKVTVIDAGSAQTAAR